MGERVRRRNSEGIELETQGDQRYARIEDAPQRVNVRGGRVINGGEHVNLGWYARMEYGEVGANQANRAPALVGGCSSFAEYE